MPHLADGAIGLSLLLDTIPGLPRFDPAELDSCLVQHGIEFMHAGIGVAMCLTGQALPHFLQDREQISQLIERFLSFLFSAVVAHDQAFLVAEIAPPVSL